MRNLAMTIGYFLLLSWFPVMAANMECSTHMISDEEVNGQTKSEIKKKCGQPDEIEGNNWYYKKESGAVYRLHFNDDGELESIQSQ